MHKIDHTTKVLFHEDKIRLEFSNSTERKSLYVAGLLFCIPGFLFAIYDCLLQGDTIEGISIIIFLAGISYFFIQEIALKEITEINFKQRSCEAKSYFFHMCQEAVNIPFPDTFTFYYKNVYDEEDKHVVEVLLIVSDIVKEKSDQEIIYFRDEDVFKKFYKLFSQHFSEYKIKQYPE